MDADTKYHTGLTGLGDLEKGMTVLILAVEQEDGSLLAKAVATGRPGGPGEGPPAGLQENPIKKSFAI